MLVLSCSVVGGIRVVKVAADGGQRPKSGKGDTEGPTPAPATCLNVAGEYTRGPEASDWVSFTQSGCSGVLSLDLGTFEFTVSGNEISVPDVGLTGEISAGPPYTITWSNGAIYTPGRATQDTEGPTPAPAPTRPAPTPPVPTPPAPTPPAPTPPAPTPTGYTFACIQPGCWCPTGFALQGTTCVQTTIPTFACIQPGCTCPYGFRLNAA